MTVIARIWSGLVPADQADDYYAYLLNTGVADYGPHPATAAFSCCGARGDATEFLFLTMWESWDAIRMFAGVPPDLDLVGIFVRRTRIVT